TKLGINQNNISAQTVSGDYYTKITDRLQKHNYDVEVFPYDWRLSLEDTAKGLLEVVKNLMEHNQPISVVAHSMGGILFRQLMFDAPEIWEDLRLQHAVKVLLLGTPWRGSHLITEVLTGEGKRVKQIGRLDIPHTRRTILKTLHQYPGLYDLLPLDEEDVASESWWADTRERIPRNRMPAIPSGPLNEWKERRDNVIKRIKAMTEDEWQHFYYIAGHADATVDGYEKHTSWWLGRQRLKFTATPLGDGSVTWERGIPKALSKDRVYYVKTGHGDLANDEELFGGIFDLLRSGRTRDSTFSKIPPVSGTRGQSGTLVPPYTGTISNLSPGDIIMGRTERGLQESRAQVLDIVVFARRPQVVIVPSPGGAF
ncbi:MAG: hypothetical protein AAF597_09045, partial [Bacteroidota bacterium]